MAIAIDNSYRDINAKEAEPLTEWENEPKIAELKQDYTDARSDHDSHTTDVDIWLDNLNIEGAAVPDKIEGRSAIQPMLIRKQAEWRYASLSEPFLSTDDIFNIDPVTFEDKDSATQNALVLNNQFNTKIDKVRFIDEYVRTAVDEGTVVVRVGWDFEEEEQPVMVADFQIVPVQDPQQAQMIQQAAQAMQQGQEVPPQLAESVQLSQQAGQPVMKIQVGEHEEMQMVTTKNQPTAEICDYQNIIVDPTCKGDLDKAGFVIYSFETSLSELKKDGKYSNLERINIDNNSILGQPDFNSDDTSSFNFTDKPRKKFVAYEYWGYWDIHGTGKVEPFVATWVGDTMIRMEENPFPDKKVPFVIAQYLPVRRSTYGEPDGELLEDNQKIIGAVTRGMIDIMGRSANGQVGSRKDALDVTNKRKFDRGQDYEYNQSIQSPEQVFYMHKYPEIPQSAGLMLQMQNGEAESLTGVKAFSGSQGITGAALGDNATGIKSALDATSKRELGILRRLAEGIKKIGRKFISMDAEFLSEEEVIRVTNDEFVTVRRDDLAGNFDLSLSISTAEADNDKAQELAFMLQTMGNNQDAELTKMIQIEIATLRKMPGLAKRLEEFQPQPDPIEQEKRMLENELLKAEIAEKLAQAEENKAEAQLDFARSLTEGSKQRKLASDADKTDLDFVEQETGTTQERQRQLQGEQARANTEKSIIEGSMKADLEDRKTRNKPAAKV